MTFRLIEIFTLFWTFFKKKAMLVRVHLHHLQFKVVGVPVPDEPNSNGHTVLCQLEHISGT